MCHFVRFSVSDFLSTIFYQRFSVETLRFSPRETRQREADTAGSKIFCYIPFIQVTADPLLILSIHYSSRITGEIFRNRIRGRRERRKVSDSDSNSCRSRCRSAAIRESIVFIGGDRPASKPILCTFTSTLRVHASLVPIVRIEIGESLPKCSTTFLYFRL